MKVLRLLLCLPLLSACQDPQARRDTAALQARVATLETQLRTMQAAPPSDARTVTASAAAQNCANSLTRSLETFRQNSLDDRYPTPAELQLPTECVDLHVNWVQRSNRAYTFTVADERNRELARQSSSSSGS
ncbi:hypothetical protein LAJ19_00065 [Deinococcus taeanensis]|uniref:hypothetical protein n=1 Tax=Deinococcus taeanensis TaxID=2737050 RepID=UPI001CDB90B4|nr:hypothetical protein [Deinococcus taeanensis]UBV42679.1 hypothetical protein LAJ19_00065 [Deinococcus taeanensis]